MLNKKIYKIQINKFNYKNNLMEILKTISENNDMKDIEKIVMAKVNNYLFNKFIFLFIIIYIGKRFISCNKNQYRKNCKRFKISFKCLKKLWYFSQKKGIQ